MVSLLKITGFFAFVTGAGFLVLDIILGPIRKISIYNLSLCYGLGIGMVSLEMFLLSLMGYGFSVFIIVLPWLTLFFWVFYRRFKSHAALEFERAKVNLSLFQWVILISIMLVALTFLILIFYKPLLGWDALTVWNHKAKIFYIDRGIDFSLFSDKLAIFGNRAHPLELPLIQTLFYLFLGTFDDLLVKIIFFVIYLGLLVGFYNFAAAMTDKTIALMGTFFLGTIPQLAEQAFGQGSGCADLLLSFFGFVSVGYLFLWLINTREKKYFYISGIFTGLAFWLKLDGFFLLPANLVTIFVYSFIYKIKFKYRILLQYALLSLSLVLPWLILVVFFQLKIALIPEKPIFAIMGDALIRFPHTLKFLATGPTSIGDWNVFWPLFLVSFILKIKSRKYKFFEPLYLNLLLQSVIIFLAIICSSDFEGIVNFASHRLYLHIVPLAMLVLCINLTSEPRLKSWKESA